MLAVFPRRCDPHVHHRHVTPISPAGTLAAGRSFVMITAHPFPNPSVRSDTDCRRNGRPFMVMVMLGLMRHLRALCNNLSGRHSKIRPYPEDGAHNR